MPGIQGLGQKWGPCLLWVMWYLPLCAAEWARSMSGAHHEFCGKRVAFFQSSCLSCTVFLCLALDPLLKLGVGYCSPLLSVHSSTLQREGRGFSSEWLGAEGDHCFPVPGQRVGWEGSVNGEVPPQATCVLFFAHQGSDSASPPRSHFEGRSSP